MAFSGVDFYEFAGRIYKQSAETDQAELRSSVSRAYYGAFLCARDLAGLAGNWTRDVHSDTYDHYVTKGQLQLANALDAMRKERNRADYSCGVVFDRRTVYLRLSSAHRILTALGQTPTAPSKF